MTDQRTLKRIISEQRVTLEKLEDENAQLRETNYDNLYSIMFLAEDKADLTKQIAEACKILNDFSSQWVDHLEGEFGQEGVDLQDWRNRMRDALLIPRSEEDKK